MRTWKAFDVGVRSLAFSPNGTTLAVAALVAGVKLLDVATGRELWHFNESSFAPQVRFTADGEKVVAFVGQRLVVLNVADGRELARHSRMLASFAVPPELDELLVVTAGTDIAEFRRIKLMDGAVVSRKAFRYHGSITRMELAADARMVGTVGDFEAMLIGVEAQKLLHARPLKAAARRTPALAFTPDGTTFVFAEKNVLHACSVDAPDQIRSTPFDGSAFHDLAFRRDGRGLLTARGTAGVEEYHPETWELQRTLDWKAGKLVRVAVSPDGALAAAGSETGNVVVWDVEP